MDFFIGNYPLDLKVTYFPKEYMEKKVRTLLGKSTLSWLKGKCREYGITADRSQTPEQQTYTLQEKLTETGHDGVIAELNDARRQIILSSQHNPSELMKWLYENQGEMRFGAENRLFLILVDSGDFEQSWKMKRAFSLIEPAVEEYIKKFSADTLKPVRLNYKNEEFTALADTLFIIR